MTDSNPPYSDDLDELLSQVDALLMPDADEVPPQPVDLGATMVFDPLDYAPAQQPEPMVYQNYSNNYGANIRNYSNGYGAGFQPEEPEPDDEPVSPAIPAYNADYRRPEIRSPRQKPQDFLAEIPPEEPAPKKPEKPQKARKKPRGCGCCGPLLLLAGAVILGLVLLFNWIFAVPKSDEALGLRKRDTAAILLCGVDKGESRTDTMMLLYLSGSEGSVSLLSLPRDTYTVTAAGYDAKLNSAYGRNGTGAEGMEGLLDYVQEIIGYRPDGYMLLGMELVPQIVELMGGLTVDVPMSFDQSGVHVEAGVQTLNGEQVLQLLRFRKGYAMQDLGRVEAQRLVISAALEQWITLENVEKIPQALALVEENTLTNLNTRNYLWMAKTVLLHMDQTSTETLPGYADYRDGVSYYFLNREEVASLINQSYNPYRTTIQADDLKIRG